MKGGNTSTLDLWTWVWTAHVHLYVDFFFNKYILQYHTNHDWLTPRVWNYIYKGLTGNSYADFQPQGSVPLSPHCPRVNYIFVRSYIWSSIISLESRDWLKMHIIKPKAIMKLAERRHITDKPTEQRWNHENI